MRKTINISVSDEMYEFILRQVREHFHYSISDYLRSLIRHDEFRREVGPTSKKRPEPISLKEFMEMDDEH
jgi:Arc/MetJ-type ribon-helix-helix transcriptional regulator